MRYNAQWFTICLTTTIISTTKYYFILYRCNGLEMDMKTYLQFQTRASFFALKTILSLDKDSCSVKLKITLAVGVLFL